MKCFRCKKKIDEFKPHIVEPIDGDVFHKECYEKYKKEREHFFDVIIHDDQKFSDYMGF